MRRIATALLALVMCIVVAAPASADPPWKRRQGHDHGWHGGSDRDPYDRGYRKGLKHGEKDARRGVGYRYDHDPVYRDGDGGYDRRYGRRSEYRREFQRGYADGYRAGYERVASHGDYRRDRRAGGVYPPVRARGAYQDPAFSRGYSEGYERGLDDARDGDRYDPVRHRDYRAADDGYDRAYGSREAYKNNYRDGFRRGYEEGYRDADRSGRREGWWPF